MSEQKDAPPFAQNPQNSASHTTPAASTLGSATAPEEQLTAEPAGCDAYASEESRLDEQEPSRAAWLISSSNLRVDSTSNSPGAESHDTLLFHGLDIPDAPRRVRDVTSIQFLTHTTLPAQLAPELRSVSNGRSDPMAFSTICSPTIDRNQTRINPAAPTVAPASSGVDRPVSSKTFTTGVHLPLPNAMQSMPTLEAATSAEHKGPTNTKTITEIQKRGLAPSDVDSLTYTGSFRAQCDRGSVHYGSSNTQNASTSGFESPLMQRLKELRLALGADRLAQLPTLQQVTFKAVSVKYTLPLALRVGKLLHSVEGHARNEQVWVSFASNFDANLRLSVHHPDSPEHFRTDPYSTQYLCAPNVFEPFDEFKGPRPIRKVAVYLFMLAAEARLFGFRGERFAPKKNFPKSLKKLCESLTARPRRTEQISSTRQDISDLAIARDTPTSSATELFSLDASYCVFRDSFMLWMEAVRARQPVRTADPQNMTGNAEDTGTFPEQHILLQTGMDQFNETRRFLKDMSLQFEGHLRRVVELTAVPDVEDEEEE